MTSTSDFFAYSACEVPCARCFSLAARSIRHLQDVEVPTAHQREAEPLFVEQGRKQQEGISGWALDI